MRAQARAARASTLLLAADNGTQENGPYFVYDWAADTWQSLAGGREGNCHDVQYAAGGDGFLWMGLPTVSSTYRPLEDETTDPHVQGIMKVDAAGGGVAALCRVPGAKDVNHAQLVENDTVAYLPSRITSSVMKARVGSDPPAPGSDSVGACAIEWSLGGADGNFTLVDERGARHAPGTQLLWHFQHNAEYFGEGLFLLVDNENRFGAEGDDGAERYNSSRFVAVEVDEAAMEARVAWSLDLHAYMPVFGASTGCRRGTSSAVTTARTASAPRPRAPRRRRERRARATASPRAAARRARPRSPTVARAAARRPRARRGAARRRRRRGGGGGGGVRGGRGGRRGADAAEGAEGAGDDALDGAWPVDPQFDVRIVELVPASKEPAWQLDVLPMACSSGALCGEIFEPSDVPAVVEATLSNVGWQLYSAERLYAGPVLSAAPACARGPDACGAGVDACVVLDTHDSVKRSEPSAGAATVVDAAGFALARAAVTFAPHWRPARVAVPLATRAAVERACGGGGAIVVSDRWGQETRAAVVATDAVLERAAVGRRLTLLRIAASRCGPSVRAGGGRCRGGSLYAGRVEGGMGQ